MLPAMATTRVIVLVAMDAVSTLHYARLNTLVTATTGVTLLANGHVVLPAVTWAVSATPVIVLAATDALPRQQQLQQLQLHSAGSITATAGATLMENGDVVLAGMESTRVIVPVAMDVARRLLLLPPQCHNA